MPIGSPAAVLPVVKDLHPLMDSLGEPAAPPAPRPEIRLGILPGSRQRELVPHIPLLLGALERLKQRFPNIKGILFAVDSIGDEYYHGLIRSALGRDLKPGELEIVRDSGHKIRSGLDLCLTKSGTGTLENAVLGLPMVVIYRTSWLTYWVARKIIQVKYISMPNLLAGRGIVPELIQSGASSEQIAEEAARLLSDPARLASQRSELIQLRQRLGPPGAYRRAAQAIAPSL
jgi:lipid-A-disaccharide synthase